MMNLPNRETAMPPSTVVGILAGDGELPLEAVRSARRQGLEAVVVYVGATPDPRLQAEASTFAHIPLSQAGQMFQFLKEHGAGRVYLLGKVEKRFIYFADFDETARRGLDKLQRRNDDALLAAVVAHLEGLGMPVGSQAELLEHVLVQAGNLTSHRPRQPVDIQLGFQVAKALAGLDVGQTVVVKDGAVVAVEAIEGTGATIRRAAELVGPGTTVVKVSKPHQDPRFDVPTVGLGTIEDMVAAGAQTLAVEAGKAFFLQRESALARAEEAGIAIVGVQSEQDGRGDPR